MGLLFSRMFSSFPGNKDVRILVLGLDNAGKTPFSEELKGAVVLIFANNQDLPPGAFDAAAVTDALELHEIESRQWAISKACAAKGEGHIECLDWLSITLKSGGGLLCSSKFQNEHNLMHTNAGVIRVIILGSSLA